MSGTSQTFFRNQLNRVFYVLNSMNVFQGLFKDMVLHLGFTIEGRTADELPESLLGCSTLHYPMLEKAVEFDV